MSDSVGVRAGLRRRRTLGKRAQTFLPDDVVMNILSWLPAKDVLRYRCVCRVWRDLTSTRDFTDLHFRHSFPLILKEDHMGLTLLDRCWEPAEPRLKIHKLYKPDNGNMVLSHNGLIVIAGNKRCSESGSIIYNPIYRDVIKITVQQYEGRVCGVFFHPIQKEFCILWYKILSFQPCKVQYRILNLESNPRWRDICTQNFRVWEIEPMFIDKYLYWINCDIIEYDIIKEEFRVIPCPVQGNYNYRDVNLVDTDGVVSVVQVIHSKESMEINIWTLNDDGEQLWMSCNYIVNSDADENSNYEMSEAIAFRNGELLLHSNRRSGQRLYAFNLKLKTFRKFGQTYRNWPKFLAHVTSLVSLKNCKSNICMVDEDENKQP